MYDANWYAGDVATSQAVLHLFAVCVFILQHVGWVIRVLATLPIKVSGFIISALINDSLILITWILCDIRTAFLI
jgi:hypothetical protein